MYSRIYTNTNQYQEQNSWQNSASYTYEISTKTSVPPILIIVLVVGGLLTLICLLVLLVRCCCCRSRGRVLAPPPLLNAEPPAAASSMHHTYLISTYPAPGVAGLPTSTAVPPPTAPNSGYELKASDVNPLVIAGFSPEVHSTATAIPMETPAANAHPPTYEQAVWKQ